MGRKKSTEIPVTVKLPSSLFGDLQSTSLLLEKLPNDVILAAIDAYIEAIAETPEYRAAIAKRKTQLAKEQAQISDVPSYARQLRLVR